MEEELIKKIDERIKEIVDTEVNVANIDFLCKLAKVKHMTKEDKCMNYGTYGRPGYDAYGYNYGRRGYDMKYRGEEQLDRLAGDYGRYMESRRYGDGEESDKAFHFMAKTLGEYLDFLYEEADTPQKKQMLNETLQRSMR